jgi:hypothetical protein
METYLGECHDAPHRFHDAFPHHHHDIRSDARALRMQCGI